MVYNPLLRILSISLGGFRCREVHLSITLTRTLTISWGGGVESGGREAAGQSKDVNGNWGKVEEQQTGEEAGSCVTLKSSNYFSFFFPLNDQCLRES